MKAQDADELAAGQMTMAFAPIHKVALGLAMGIVGGSLVAVVTIGHVLLDPSGGPYLGLLAQYFYGYRVTPLGALTGLFWGFVTGFVAGWFLAFVCNLAVTVTIFALRTKAELKQTNDFLDHI